jgi:WD40 repeat protein
MKRIEKAVLWTWVPALVFVVSSTVTAAEPEGFEQTQLESGVTVADIEPLKDGRLLMVLDHDGELRASFSHDDGKTWKASFQLLPKPDGNAGYHHPSVTRAANGDLLLSYQYYVRKTRPVYKISYYRRSKDEGETWGDQLFMAADGLFNDKPIVLSTGRLIAPVEREARVAGGDHAGYVSSVFFSDDNGYSWTRSNEVDALPIEAQEPHVVELKDGRLMMLCRTYSRFVLRSYSTDKGKTWSKGEPIQELELPAWSSALNVKRIPSTGDLLLLRSLHGEDGVRSPFVSVISKDDGKTWTNERIIAGDPKERYGYPCLLFIDETAIVGYGSFAGSRVARIPVKWFYETPRADRAVHTADRTLRGHAGSTTGLAWHPDGKLLACACFDKTIGIWDVETGKRRQTLSGHTQYVYCVAWNRDGTKLTSASYDGTVKLWDAKTGRELWTNRDHAAAVMSVTWSPDNSKLASGSLDKTVRVLNAADGKTLQVLKGHTHYVISVSWSPDGKTLASGGFDDVVRLWDPIAGKASGTLDGHTDAIEMVYWSPDGKRLASGGRDLSAILWAMPQGKKLHVLKGHSRRIESVSWSPDGTQLATGSQDKTVKVWSTRTGQLLHTLSGHEKPVRGVVWSPNGKLLASGSDDHSIRIWDMSRR